MKYAIILFCFMISLNAYGQTHYKKDGTPDMRYKENKEMYGNGYQNNSFSNQSYQSPTYNNSYNNSYQNSYQSTPSSYDRQPANYNQGGQLYMQDGYIKSNGTYVEPHLKTKPDNQQWNNYNNLYK